MNPQFNKGVLEMCVLALLAKRDCYGFELVEAVSKYVGLSDGTIYPLLRRLTKEEYVETYLQESPTGPPRKYYRMTAKGLEFTRKLIESWRKFSKNIDLLLHFEAKHE